jgi:hypothetical protein
VIKKEIHRTIDKIEAICKIGFLEFYWRLIADLAKQPFREWSFAVLSSQWHTVFIIWALDGHFPSAHALYKEEELEEDEWRCYAYTFYFTIYDISL